MVQLSSERPAQLNVPQHGDRVYFTPELLLKDGRIIRDLGDAVSFAREQEVRPGVDQRDEILHRMERASAHARTT
jgi:hypothetical protein